MPGNSFFVFASAVTVYHSIVFVIFVTIQITTMRTLFAIALITVSLSGCHKNSDSAGSDPTPILTLTAPVNNQTFTNGDLVSIQGAITDNSLHSLTLKITSGSTSLYNKTISVHDSTHYNINDNWKSSVTAVTNATVTAEVEDHGGHVVTQTVSIKINP